MYGSLVARYGIVFEPLRARVIPLDAEPSASSRSHIPTSPALCLGVSGTSSSDAVDGLRARARTCRSPSPKTAARRQVPSSSTPAFVVGSGRLREHETGERVDIDRIGDARREQRGGDGERTIGSASRRSTRCGRVPPRAARDDQSRQARRLRFPRSAASARRTRCRPTGGSSSRRHARSADDARAEERAELAVDDPAGRSPRATATASRPHRPAQRRRAR